MPRRMGAAVDGVLLLDKPAGLTSNAALQAVRRLFGAPKAGHTGTLDPMATGLLPIAFGEATKFSQLLLDADKRYLAEMQLGIETDTGDREGVVIASADPESAEPRIREAVARFAGGILQVPPMYSALKRDGRPLYELARQGITVDREPRRVTVHAIEILAIRGARVTLDIHCSKGTYVRVLATDIGRALGCGAHLVSLRRTQIGGLPVAQAVTVDSLQAREPADRLRLLRPIDALAGALDLRRLDVESTTLFLQGQQVGNAEVVDGRLYRVYGGDRFLGVGLGMPDGRLAPRRLVSTAAAKASAACRAA